ncbi:UDP-4-amino-4,6-dideoxy-N-acetyl-beta-L-altrosamine N-acetyltransferase [Marinobacter daqiaonensis]|uniref:UDP-4-amino-4,6-dideoxy-N-acetyl-beta-L-altrosamine N-acetyltransferase n=1 Tax=Marinobacter daqiaonensis TaxID=650891 RepID=A0A1I6K3B4_9GAMM|nr:UDP-4-amino-4,6-dideoxy-N-acetyl-beta-L-altrosamine N-acetyltransferase [Marinobacter daqiaonensis]SFR85310.1 UDP-4-amino-4,6-dideoxy-N-acetyl-beta-L-altrosamine N-acetyltransferase [Marinobacter daqiaonensis]
MSGSLRTMTEDDLERVRRWRNHPDVRRYMYTTHEIDPAEHRAWFERTRDSDRSELMIYEDEGLPLGFVNLARGRSRQVADWGFYLAPEAARGTGKALGRAALRHAFEGLELHKVCGQALGFNDRSIKFHRSLGFVQEGCLRDQHYDGQAYHDVVCFGLLRQEWKNSLGSDEP